MNDQHGVRLKDAKEKRRRHAGQSAMNDQHGVRLKELVQFTASSLETAFPSPFGCAIYDERAGALVAQAYDTVMEMCDPTSHAETNAIREAARKLQRLSLPGCTLSTRGNL
jgi:tRNA(Arg) A34 adenosine deaminase TadA